MTANEFRRVEINESCIDLIERLEIPRDYVKNKFKEGRKITVVVYLDKSEQLVGFFWLTLGGEKDKQYVMKTRDAILLSKIYIAPQYRGQGLALTLMNDIFEVCRLKGASMLFAAVRKNNVSAWKMYKKTSYQPYRNALFFRVFRINIPQICL